MIAKFPAHRRQQLHADTDAQERHAFFQNFFPQHVHHAGHRLEAAHAISKGADTRQHDAFRIEDDFWIGGGDDFLAGIAGGARQRLRRRGEVAGAIINQGRAHIRFSSKTPGL